LTIIYEHVMSVLKRDMCTSTQLIKYMHTVSTMVVLSFIIYHLCEMTIIRACISL